MLICPICKTQYQKGDEFCKNEGAKLVPIGTVGKTVDMPKGSDTSPTAGSSRSELQELKTELTQREKRVAELEAELGLVRSELNKLQESPATPGRPTPEGQSKPQTTSSGKESTKSKGLPLADTVKILPLGWLECVSGPLKGKKFPIRQEGLRIGRPKKNSKEGDISIPDISIPNPRVSHAHAWIGLANDAVVVRADRSSTNETFVNGTELTKGGEVVLNSGDAIIIVEEEFGKFVFRK